MYGSLRKHKEKQISYTILAIDSDLIGGVKSFMLILGDIYLWHCVKPFEYVNICEILYKSKKNMTSYYICCMCK